MNRKIDLSGEWRFALDPDKIGLRQNFVSGVFGGRMKIPGSVSAQKLSSENTDAISEDHLTDPYYYEGYAWCGRMVRLDKSYETLSHPRYFLHLERTRKSCVFVNESYAGRQESFCTPHVYDITEAVLTAKKNGGDRIFPISILMDNSSYISSGGHMTSPDSQTNWLGITGGIYITVKNNTYLKNIRLLPDCETGQIEITADIIGDFENIAVTAAVTFADGREAPKISYTPKSDKLDINYDLGLNYKLWDEFNPVCYEMKLTVTESRSDGVSSPDVYLKSFGFSKLHTRDGRIYSGENELFLRGKHDALLFPLTGFAPCDTGSWLKRFRIAKSYGINLYRFHTCCPPEAAFIAADTLGMYLAPELPFWGTVKPFEEKPKKVTEGNEGNVLAIKNECLAESETEFLFDEAERIVREFGSHPSFVMFSLGNELWGDKDTIRELLRRLKDINPRILYTQGSNNFQFEPEIFPEDDFFVGVRFGKNELIRGSFAMCDAPQGFIQTSKPTASASFDSAIKSDIPVISHEIGQYYIYPDYSTLDRYKGVLKPENFKIFRDRLEAAGLLDRAEEYFNASGRFAASLYKCEIETALRTEKLSGFHLLDLQDFTGQGTATVGILDAFMENKGLISREEFTQSCAPLVVFATFNKFTYVSEEVFTVHVSAANYSGRSLSGSEIFLKIGDGKKDIITLSTIFRDTVPVGRTELAVFSVKLPFFGSACKLTMSISAFGVKNSYTLWCYPDGLDGFSHQGETLITSDTTEAVNALSEGKNVFFYPTISQKDYMLPGTYATDFWNYKMFSEISLKQKKPLPVGTLGLSIKKDHPALRLFPTEDYTSPQWYDIVTTSSALILDGSETADITPIVSFIDNVYRNHNLALIFEACVGDGKLLVCTANIARLLESCPAMQLVDSLLSYMQSPDFNPQAAISPAKFRLLFTL
ncbi:MAG: beta-glucuronidase [Ruminococcus sp.]|jgi:hypothetical protein|nr:beta-glucuronidase [Ruminococcus sp.]